MVPLQQIVEYLLSGLGLVRLPAPIPMKIGTEKLYTNVFQLGCLAPVDLAGILILGLEGYPFWKLSGISTFCARLNSELRRGIILIFFSKMKLYISFML